VLAPDRFCDFDLARDGRRLAVEMYDPRRSTADLWIVDLDRNVPTRLTSSPRSELSPKWSPDGSRLAFSTDWQGPPNLYLADVARIRSGAGRSALALEPK
jgi:Tol biopolymer transport system component